MHPTPAAGGTIPGVTAAAIDAQLDAASPLSVWLDTADRPAPRPPLEGDVVTDLVVVGGGFTGLWTALRAKERDPGRRVLLVEADRIAEHATGRNGGFCEASLTHGEANGRDRWPDEYDRLDRLGRENLAAIAETVERYGIDCDLRLDGVLTVATREHEVAGLEPVGLAEQRAGSLPVDVRDTGQVQVDLDRPAVGRVDELAREPCDGWTVQDSGDDQRSPVRAEPGQRRGKCGGVLRHRLQGRGGTDGLR